MSAESAPLSASSLTILRQLAARLDAIEAELKKLDWWHDQPPDLLGEVKAGRLRSYLDAPTFELWLQCVFLPNARERLADREFPEGSSVGEMARREYDYHSTVEEAKPLLGLLAGFDELIVAWNESRRAPQSPVVTDPSMPGELTQMFADSRGLLLHWLDLLEDQLKKLGWWDGDVPVTYGRWMRESFLPETRDSILMGVVPQMTGLADHAKQRLAAENLPVPEEHRQILTTYDQSVSTYHSTWQICGLPPAVPHAGAVANPPAYAGEFGGLRPRAAPRRHLKPVPGQAMDFENVLAGKRDEMLGTLGDVAVELDRLTKGDEAAPATTAGGEDTVEEWLAEEFLPDLHQWLDRGQVPQESRVAQSANEEWTRRGMLPQTSELLKHLQAFDAQVTAWHSLSRALERDTATNRIAAAWSCIMAVPELRSPLGPEPDSVRWQMLLTLNRVEAELILTGWWSAVPPALPAEFAAAPEYSAGRPDRELLPPFQHWLQAAFLPKTRERIQSCEFPDSSRLRDDANRALSEERLGAKKFQESRRLYLALGEFETLLLRAWPAALRRHRDTRRQRGLMPPAAEPLSGNASARDCIIGFRNDVEEALRLAIYELKELGWWNENLSGIRERLAGPRAGSIPFEHWFKEVFVPDAFARLKDGRPLEERRVSDYVAWECRLPGQSDRAANLLVQLEKFDHWSADANRAEHEAWED